MSSLNVKKEFSFNYSELISSHLNFEESEKINTKQIPKNKIQVYEKPNYSYIALISQAIRSKPDKKITLREIYKFISENYPYYRFNQSRWQNSVRHNLSLNNCFIRLSNLKDKSVKGSYWTIKPYDDEKNDLNKIKEKNLMYCKHCLLKENSYLKKDDDQKLSKLKFSIDKIINS